MAWYVMEEDKDPWFNPHGLKKRIGPFPSPSEAEKMRARLLSKCRRGKHRASMRYSVEERS